MCRFSWTHNFSFLVYVFCFPRITSWNVSQNWNSKLWTRQKNTRGFHKYCSNRTLVVMSFWWCVRFWYVTWFLLKQILMVVSWTLFIYLLQFFFAKLFASNKSNDNRNVIIFDEHEPQLGSTAANYVASYRSKRWVPNCKRRKVARF